VMRSSTDMLFLLNYRPCASLHRQERGDRGIERHTHGIVSPGLSCARRMALSLAILEPADPTVRAIEQVAACNGVRRYNRMRSLVCQGFSGGVYGDRSDGDDMTQIERVAMIGTGTMGRMIALRTAQHGIPVILYDSDPVALERARAAIHDMLASLLAQGTVARIELDAIESRLRYAVDLGGAVRDVDLVIEAIPERVDLKRALFAQLDELCRDSAIVATNSSSIRVSYLENATTRPEQVANFHFYNPVWDIPMVEIGRGTKTNDATVDALTAFARRIGLLPLHVRKESTGFIFNRVWRAIKKETLKVVDTGVASFEDVDRAWMTMYHTEMGPFGKMDEIGLDVVKDIEEHYASESGDPSDLPPKILTERVARGDLGVKTGRGFYTYPDPAWAAPGFLKPDE
jgi:3-hydroxybutyryl-CoA dehydrogenase